MTRWDLVVVGCLGTIALPALDEPDVLFRLFPITVLLGTIAIAGTLRGLRPAMHRASPLGRVSEIKVALSVVIAASLVGVVASFVPIATLGTVSPLSRDVAPAVWALLLVAATRAVRVPSPRRIAIAIGTISAAWPVLLAIRAAHMRPYGRALALDPYVLHTFAACIVAITALALILANATRRACTAPEPVLPPRAEVIDR